MQGISGGKTVDRRDQSPGCSDFSHPVSEYVINYSVQAIEGGSYGFKTPYRRVSVKNLLVDFHVSDEAFACAHQLGKKRHDTILVWMWRADQIHRDIGVNENHAGGRGGSLSRSIVSMSAVGN